MSCGQFTCGSLSKQTHSSTLPVSMKQVPATWGVTLGLVPFTLVQLLVALALLLLAAVKVDGVSRLPKTLMGMGLPC